MATGSGAIRVRRGQAGRPGPDERGGMDPRVAAVDGGSVVRVKRTAPARRSRWTNWSRSGRRLPLGERPGNFWKPCREDRVALHLRLRNGPMDAAFYQLAAERLSGIAAGETGGWCVINGRVDVASDRRVRRPYSWDPGALPVRAARIARPVMRIAIGAFRCTLKPMSARARGRAAGADYTDRRRSMFSTATHPDRTPAGPAPGDIVRRGRRAGRGNRGYRRE